MRKYKLPDELASLDETSLQQVNSWLRKYTYADVREKCRHAFNFDITVSKLCRYYQRLRDVEDLNHESGHPLTVDDLIKMKNGEPLPDEKVNRQLIQYACFKMVQRPGQTAADLKDLFQIVVHEQQAELSRKRLILSDRWANLRERSHALKQRRLAEDASNAGPVKSDGSDGPRSAV
jgi:hypothetical protein